MKIHLMIPPTVATWFEDLKNLLSASLLDCGHELTNEEDADTVIVIQHLSRQGGKLPGKKYILIETEQRRFGRHDDFKPDKIWSSDISLEGTEYIYLGWHPILTRPDKGIEKNINIGLIGCGTPRRNAFLESIKNKFQFTNTWNFEDKINTIHRTKICLNYHSYEATTYTEWGRLSFLLANKAFVLSESFYCPLPIVQFTTNEEYDNLVEEFLINDKRRIEIAENIYEVYKKDFDMRDLLGRLL